MFRHYSGPQTATGLEQRQDAPAALLPVCVGLQDFRNLDIDAVPLIVYFSLLGVVGLKRDVTRQVFQLIERVSNDHRLARPWDNPQKPRQLVGSEALLH